MITEIAMFTAAPGKADELGAAILQGLAVIRQHPACLSARVERCLEQPEQFAVINSWTSLEAHVIDFRGGPLFVQWRSQLSGLYVDQPVVFHYQELAQE
jgi:quinol monooxygenase YgiN